MINMISSDIYRLRYSRGLRNIFIGLVILILIAAASLYIITSEGFTAFLFNTVDNAGSIVSQNDLEDLSQAKHELAALNIDNAAVFAGEIMSSNFMPFFFLFFIMMFCSEFSNGTYRNTNSYEDNRNRVYFAKLLLSIACSVLFFASSIFLSWLIGGIFFGFDGVGAQYFTQIAITFLLMLPTQIAMVSLGHCIVAFTKKSGATVAIYLIGITVYSVIIQTLAMLPRMKWLTLLDWSSNSQMMISYWTLPTSQILLSVFAWFAAVILFAVLGAVNYRRSDLH